jgi:hypothetical protein
MTDSDLNGRSLALGLERSSHFPTPKNSQKITKNPEKSEESRSGLGS